MKVFLVHGAFGSPEGNWFPWLKKELENKNYEVIVPKFPTPVNQNLNNWIKIFEPYFNKLDENSILVGHSLGCAFILNILERIEIRVKKVVLVAPFAGFLNNPKFDEVNKTFLDKNFNWDKIKGNCSEFVILYSDNDPYVPEKKVLELSKNLGIEPVLIKGGRHLNKKAGFSEFPELLELIG